MPLEIDDFDEIAARTPVIASLTPGGHYVATDLYDAGGCALVARELAKRDLLHLDARNVDGRTLRRDRPRRAGDRGPEGRRHRSSSRSRAGRLRHPARKPRPRRLRGQAGRTRAHLPRADRRACSTPRRSASPRSRRARSSAGDVVVIRYEGPAGGPGHARDARRHRGDRGRRAVGVGRAAHRRALLGRHARFHGRARLRPRPPGAGRSPPCARATRSSSTSRRASSESSSPTTRSRPG